MLSKFDKYVEDGLISRKVSPCGKLVLFDYTEKCQYEKAWDEITLNARGTVYELSTGAVVARAFPKFFNFSELSAERQSQLLGQKFTVAEKMDGSLGIVYFYDGEWRVNTRGSFVSDQAIKGKKLLDSTYLLTHVTYLFEIIYPENRIVVDYKKEEKLVLLAAYSAQLENFEHTDYTLYKGEKAKEYSFDNLQLLQSKLKELSFNEEGYVVKFEDGTRAKFKGEEYVRMHRIISGMSPLVLWESMENGKVCTKLMSEIPEEFRAQYEVMAERLEDRHESLRTSITMLCNLINLDVFNFEFTATPEDRKQPGLYLKANEHELNGFVFPFFVGKEGQLDEMIRKEIRPTGNVI